MPDGRKRFVRGSWRHESTTASQTIAWYVRTCYGQSHSEVLTGEQLTLRWLLPFRLSGGGGGGGRSNTLSQLVVHITYIVRL